MTLVDDPSRRNTGPAGTTVNTILAEDPVFTHGTITVLENSPVALFANPNREGAEEFFVLDADSHLTYVHRAPTGDGWVQEEFNPGTPQTVSDVVTAVHPDGSVWLFVSYGSAEGGLNAYRLEKDGSWNGLPFAGPVYGWRHLSVHYLPDRPATPCLVGVDAARTQLRVLMPRFRGSVDDQMFWVTALLVPLTTPLPEMYHAGLQMDGTLRIYAEDGGMITMRTYTGVWERERLVAGGPGTPRLVGLWNSPEGLGCVFADGNGRPCAYTPGGGSMAWELSTQVLTKATAWQDEQGLLHIFGTGPDTPGVLQVIHQRGWVTRPSLPEPLIEPLFVSASYGGLDVVISFPLAAGVGAFHVDPAPDVYPSQLIVPTAPGLPFRVASQDVTTSWWSDEPVLLSGAGGVVELQRRYVGDVTLVDAFGAPMPHWPVQLSAQSAVDVEVAGRMLRLGPTHTAHAVTDGVGKLDLRVAASGLTVPTIQLSARGITGGASVDVAAGVQGFLAATSVLAAHRKPLSAQQLLQAKVGDDWLVPGWHGKGDPDVTLPGAQEVVDLCARVFALTQGTPLVEGITLRTSRAGETPGDALGVTADLASYLHDLQRGIRDGVLDVTGVTVTPTGRAVIECVPPGGLPISFTYDLVAAGDASLTVEAVFQLVGAGVDRLVEWLSWAVPFADVWTTAEALSAGVADLPAVFSATAKHYREYGKGGWFEAHQKQVDDAFAALRAQVDGVRVDSLQGLSPLTRSLPAPVYQSDTLVTPQSTWFHDLLLRRGSQHAESAGDPDPDPEWDSLWRLFTVSTPGENFLAALDKTQTALLALWDLDDARTVDGTTMQSVLDIAEGLVPQLLPLADVMIDQLCTTVESIAEELGDLLDTPVLEQELVDTYVWFQRQAGVPSDKQKALTLGGLGALYTAFPITGAYLTLLGTPPFRDAEFPALAPPPWGASSAEVTARPEHALRMQVIGGVARMLSAGSDTLLDLGETNRWLNIGIAWSELAGFALAGYPEFRDTPSDTDTADEIAWAQWAVGSTFAALDAYLSSVPEQQTLLTAYSRWQGSGFVSMAGIAQIALAGAAYAASNQHDLDQEWLTTSVAASLPALTAHLRPLRNLSPEQQWAGGGLAFKALLDVTGDAYSGLTQTAFAVNEIVNPVFISSTTLPVAKVGAPYAASVTAAGGCPPYSWLLENFAYLPAGLHFDGDTGQFSGTPAVGTQGSHDLVFTAFDDYRPSDTSPRVTLRLSVTA